jgi:hypothetical protein
MKAAVILMALAALATPAIATHGILLVSDQVDGVTLPQFFDEYYESAIRDAGYTFAKWDHYTRGQPTYEDLRPYKIVIWFTSTSGQAPASDPLRGSLTLSAAEQDTLVQYLAFTPGKTALMLSGPYIAWNCVANAVNENQYYKPLFSDYLKLNYPHDNFVNWINVTDNWKLRGESGCPILDGKTYNITWRHHSTYPDQLEPGSGGAASAWWIDLSARQHHRAVIHAEGAKANGGQYRTALFACPFENIVTDEARAEVMKNFLVWAGINEVEDAITPASLGRVKTLFR